MKNLSIRQYAKLIGASHTAVNKAIKAEYIVKGFDPVSKKIIVDIANSEWGNSIIERKETTGKDDENKKPFQSVHLDPKDFEPVGEKISLSEARRKKEIYAAEIGRLTVLREMELYIEKDRVVKQLHDFGVSVRIAFETIPNKSIDKILASKNRAEAYGILTDEIHDALITLTKPPIS